MTDHIIDTNVVPDSTGGHAAGQVGTTHSGIDSENNGIRNTVRELLGDHIRLNELMSLGNLDYHTGFDHTTTSLPYAIHVSLTHTHMYMSTLIYSTSAYTFRDRLPSFREKLPCTLQVLRIPSKVSWVLPFTRNAKSSSSADMSWEGKLWLPPK